LPVQTITIEGLRKTREPVVRDLIPAAVGDTFTTATVQSVTDALVDSDLFAEVVVSAIPVEDGAELVVTVDEKWTIVPIPFVSTNGSSFDGGLILLESNLFGRNKQLISAGFAGSGGRPRFFSVRRSVGFRFVLVDQSERRHRPFRRLPGASRRGRAAGVRARSPERRIRYRVRLHPGPPGANQRSL
jgi:hypothetical protein